MNGRVLLTLATVCGIYINCVWYIYVVYVCGIYISTYDTLRMPGCVDVPVLSHMCLVSALACGYVRVSCIWVCTKHACL